MNERETLFEQRQAPITAAARKRIVVLDSDSGVRWSLEKGLGRSGYQVTASGSLSEVLRWLHQDHVDCVILEILPEAA